MSMQTTQQQQQQQPPQPQVKQQLQHRMVNMSDINPIMGGKHNIKQTRIMYLHHLVQPCHKVHMEIIYNKVQL